MHCIAEGEFEPAVIEVRMLKHSVYCFGWIEVIEEMFGAQRNWTFAPSICC